MRIWLDTEFIDNGQTIDLISVGMVREDNKSYYAESADCDLSKASLWVSQNVIPSLRGGAARKPRHQIAREIVEFCGREPELWAYFADYDWVAVCQLFGRMMDLPKGWPMFCLDVQQLRYLSNDKGELPTLEGNAHNALDDAIWCWAAWRQLTTPPPTAKQEAT